MAWVNAASRYWQRRLVLSGSGETLPWLFFAAGPGRRRVAFRTEAFQDRAIRAVVSMAIPCQMVQRGNHFVEFAAALFEFTNMGKGERFHVCAGAAAVFPKIEQCSDLPDLEPKVACTPHEA